MFELGVRSDLSIAHSLRGEEFGIAQNLHGATYEVELVLSSSTLSNSGIVMDMGEVLTILESTLEPLNYRNLDELEITKGLNTTTEELAKLIAEEVRKRIDNCGRLSRIKVTLWETNRLWASYEIENP